MANLIGLAIVIVGVCITTWQYKALRNAKLKQVKATTYFNQNKRWNKATVPPPIKNSTEAKNMRTFYLYDNNEQILKEVLVDEDKETLPVFYDSLECELIDMPYFTNGIYIVCDDMGLMKQPKNINFIYDTSNIQHRYVGKMMFVSIDEDGETIGLNEAQIAYLKEHVAIKTVPIELALH